MNIFKPFIKQIKQFQFHTKNDHPNIPIDDEFNNNSLPILSEKGAYLYSAWVNIAVGILIRNIARAQFVLTRGGNDVTCGPLYELFRRPNNLISGYDLWKETAAWWYLEGEAYWWAGPDYSGGIPKELFVLDPRRLRNESYNMGDSAEVFRGTNRRWFYDTGRDSIPILNDELIQFRDWNPWNPVRGVNPLAALALELEQDYFANKANSQLLKNNAIPMGILKTDQVVRPGGSGRFRKAVGKQIRGD
jgi:HK97 family phage portal protein